MPFLVQKYIFSYSIEHVEKHIQKIAKEKANGDKECDPRQDLKSAKVFTLLKLVAS